MKRGATGLCGVLAIDKPYGMTSHDVVDRVRRITGERRVGHAGTLDPTATGLMLVGVGAATRLTSYLTGHDKAYRARIVFGASTDTDDSEGRVIGGSGAEEAQELLSALGEEGAAGAVSSLAGTSMQTPPAYSAIKKNGVAAYKAAREGAAIEVEPRQVTVYQASLEGRPSVRVSLPAREGPSFEAELPCWDVYLRVSKGTYIRSIARDLGATLGCGAYLGALRRVSIADFGIERAVTLEDVERCARDGEELPWCDPAALLGFPVLELDDSQADDVCHGRQLQAPSEASQVSCVSHNRLLAVYTAVGGTLRPATVIPGGVVGVA